MPAFGDITAIRGYWDRESLVRAIFDTLQSLGTPADRLTIDDLAQFDQFHGGGKEATSRLARAGGLQAGMHVLDVGGGLGGPARTLAVEHGCRVMVIDLTESYVRAGAALTALLRLDEVVSHCVGTALQLPFAEATFDALWTQNSGMNVAAKERMYAEFHRVLRPGGRLVFQEPMAGPVQPPLYPLMWADDESTNFLRTPAQMQALIERAGFAIEAWDDVTMQASGGRAPAAGPSIQSLVMGEALPLIAEIGRRNRDEGRVVVIHARCRRR